MKQMTLRKLEDKEVFYETCGYEEIDREKEAVMIEGEYKDLMWCNYIL